MTEKKTQSLQLILNALSQPSAWPWPVDEVVIVHTHASAVLLAGDYVLKLKKPVDFGFLDYSTRERRRHYCAEETRLNRRLAAEVYLGVAGVEVSPKGIKLHLPEDVDLDDPALEPAVLMARLSDDRTLAAGLQHGWVGAEEVKALARRLARFHTEALRSPEIASFAHFETVAGNARENFEQTAMHRGVTVTEAVWASCREATETMLAELRETIDARAEQHACASHGDLRLDHVYFLDDRVEVIDCIEFNERFRYSDAASDIAFLSMELRFAGRPDFAELLERTWAAEYGGERAYEVLPFYVAYRSIVRGKVRGFLALDEEAPAASREEASRKSAAHWLLAHRMLQHDRLPSVVLVGGLPGTGKSTVAAGLAKGAGYHWIRADVVRKELAGLSASEDAAAPFGKGIYTEEWTERTYARCVELAREALLEGDRVVVDATFRSESRRSPFEALASELRTPLRLLICESPPAITRERIRARVGGPSDAGVAVYDRAASEWGMPARAFVVDTSGTIEESHRAALNALGASVGLVKARGY